MAAGTTPIFPDAVAVAIGQATTANTARDGSGTIADGYTAGADGGRVDKIVLCYTGTSTTNVARIFQKVSGGTYRLWREILIPAVTPSTTVETWRCEIVEPDGRPLMVLGAAGVVGFATDDGEDFNFFVYGSDY